jgi:acetyl-CoA acetyltransferase
MEYAYICDALRTPFGRYGGALAGGLLDDAAYVNPNGGAIALGHPLGARGARLPATAVRHLHRCGGRYALCAERV